MISYEEMIQEVSSLKVSSDQLSTMFRYACDELNQNYRHISAVVKGSHTGQEAVISLEAAIRSLQEAVVSINVLSRTCDECVSQLSR